jgi:predicted O-methyltransferase YrrM
MEHFYQNIPGWFSYEYVYKDIVEQADDNSLFVEIGSYKGMSSAFMAVEIANSGKKIRFECIDPMKMLGGWDCTDEQKQNYSATDFHNRLVSVVDYYKLQEMTSDDAAKLYEDASIDFLMIDGEHSYDAVFKDITNYLPKMRSGGLIVGDDAYEADVQRALADAAGHLNPVNNGIHFFISIP